MFVCLYVDYFSYNNYLFAYLEGSVIPNYLYHK